MIKNNPFRLQSRIDSFKHAFDGLGHFFKTEPNSWIHLVVMVIVLITGFLVQLSALEWMLICIVIGLVITSEVINTAIERVCDLVTTDYHPLAKQAKDLASGAVLTSAITAVILGVIILGPKIFPPQKDFVNELGINMIRIESGVFIPSRQLSGGSVDHPAQRIKITRDFYISSSGITNGQFAKFQPEHAQLRGENGQSLHDDSAVIVSRGDAAAFCHWLTQTEGRYYRLPTEDEWEYACRQEPSRPDEMDQKSGFRIVAEKKFR